MEEAPPDHRPYALIVDDEPVIRMLAVDILEDAGFRSFEADSTKWALEILQEHHASIVLMFTDVEILGPQNGFALAREVSRLWPEIGILVASGRIVPADTDLPEDAHFVGKPFSAEVIHGRLKQLLLDDRKPKPLKG